MSDEESQSTSQSESYQSSDDSDSSSNYNNKYNDKYNVTNKDRRSIDEIINKYGYNSSQSESDEIDGENIFESVLEEWESSRVCQIDDPHDILKTIPVSYLYSYFDTIQSTIFDIFGENNIYTSECVQVFDNTYIDHEVLFIDYADKEEDVYIVGFKHKSENNEYCVGLRIDNSHDKQIHCECSCEKYGDMEYIKIPIIF